MRRDYRKLEVFQEADELVLEVYPLTRALPPEERFEMSSQVRRACVSVPTNIVEGCLRRSERSYLHFLDIAISSAAETHYLLGLCVRLGLLSAAEVAPIVQRYDVLLRRLHRLIERVEALLDRTR